jgi:hypothetical protein
MLTPFALFPALSARTFAGVEDCRIRENTKAVMANLPTIIRQGSFHCDVYEYHNM